MGYVDGLVIAVPTENREKYLDMAKWSVKHFKAFGALRVVECWGDQVPDGEVTSFPMAVKAKEGETVCFSWIEWESKAARDAAMPKVIEKMQEDGMAMPFDGQRMIYGGFEMILDE